MALDVALYAERLLDWLYDKQAVLVRQQQLKRQAKDEALKRFFQERHSDPTEVGVLFEAFRGPQIMGETEPKQGYVNVGVFLKPLGVRSLDGSRIVDHMRRLGVATSDFWPGGNWLAGTLLGEEETEPKEIEEYGEALITEAGIQAAGENRRAWHEVMPQAAPLAQRLLVWLSAQEDPSRTPAYFPNFLVSGHGCYGGRPLFTAVALQKTVRHLVSNHLLDDFSRDSAPDSTMKTQLTSRGWECVVSLHGDAEQYLNRAPQAGSTTITVTGSTGVNIANHSPSTQQSTS